MTFAYQWLRDLEPVHDLLRVDHAALKPASKCSFTTSKLRFFAWFRGAAIGVAWL
jgi:hypothetical protein